MNKNEESTHLGDTGLVVELEHLLWIKKGLFIIKSTNWELKTRPIYDCRYDERLEPKYDEFKCLVYTGYRVVYYKSRKRELKVVIKKTRSEDKTSLFVYYESIKRGLKRLIYWYRWDERLKTKSEESTRLSDTGYFFWYCAGYTWTGEFVYYESMKRKLI
jgi:hypothetical protein